MPIFMSGKSHRFIFTGIFIVVIFVVNPVSARGQLTAIIADSLDHSPIPFANVIFQDGKSGTVSNMKGEFILSGNIGDSITISSVGYHTRHLATKDVIPFSTIYLAPKTITLDPVNIYPGENPALKIMEKVVQTKNKNNPDKQHNYSCLVYHKMTFDFRVPKETPDSDSIAHKIIEFSKDHHLLLMESVSEKKHLVPDKNKEKVISGRVSGFEDTSLALLPSQLQPFGFYSDHISLMDTEFLNPASVKGLKNYIFILEDTIVEKGDSLFYITFLPKKDVNIKPLSGSFHIHQNTYGIKNIKVSSKIAEAPFQLDIIQRYQRIENTQWFPAEMESQLTIHANSGINSMPYPLVGKSKSIVTAVDLDPDLNQKEFSSVVFEDEMHSDTTGIEVLRYEPLTPRDSATYHLIDSIGKANKLDNIIKLQKNLMRGYLAAGPLRIDIDKVIGYNKFEGLKLGMGLWTGPGITGDFSLGGYYNHAFKSKKNNYGGGIKWSPEINSQTGISITYSNDMHTTGNFSFHKGKLMNMETLLKNYSVSTMDRESKVMASAESRITGSLSGKVFFSHSEVEPIRIYNFTPDATIPSEPFSNIEYGINLRWSHKEKISKTAFGILPYPSLGPKVWVNYIRGNQKKDALTDSYTKIESQIEKTFRTGPAARTSLRITGGWIDGWNTPSNLYSFFGTYEPFTVEIPFMFATMAPNEFAADRFFLIFLNHKIPLRQNKPGSFKPELKLISKAGWGDITASNNAGYKTFDKGYFESGILLENLFNTLFIKYGLAVHYHYGPYKKEKELDNWSFRISLDFAF